jgi:DNA helicase-2/ATP-dependent DNA helicase PcrA
MIPKINEKPTVLIAGAGAGKTHDMVSKIVHALGSLRSNRILAAITFTNAATNSIKERLQAHIDIPPNVFVGTNHSFFCQFILLPFGTLFGCVGSDPIFCDIDIRKIIDKQCRKSKNPAIRSAVRAKTNSKLVSKGTVPFEQIAPVSAKLMDNPRVRDIVSNRIQYLFIDEFQDIDIVQLKIFDAIRKTKKTSIYAVGDPEQYILGFTYGIRGVAKPHFAKIPINRYAETCNKCQIDINKRATSQLVKFTNKFHTSIEQVSGIGYVEKSGVYFLMNTDMDKIISTFIDISYHGAVLSEFDRLLFLGYENNTFDGYVERYCLRPLANDNTRLTSVICEAIDLITSSARMSAKCICVNNGMSTIEFRKLGIKMLRSIISKNIGTPHELCKWLTCGFKISSPQYAESAEKILDKISQIVCTDIINSNRFHSSIHKAKGLEAECVLVVAKSREELAQWLITDRQKRFSDKNDTCRIGYVAFTRAKRLLCIACREPLDCQLESKLVELMVRMI